MSARSGLERTLLGGKFAVTAEIGPPKSASAESVRRHAHEMKGSADAFNLTDNQTAMSRMSSIACAAVLIQEGLEPVVQMTCRDRNRIAMQSDILGASALGVRNVLCISGDHQTFGNMKEAKNVYDVDSVQELMILRKMRDEGRLWSGDELETAPELFLGAAANPFADPFEFRVTRLAKKVKAGADFIQTQSIYDMDRFERWMALVRARGLHEKVHILAGVMPLKSHKVALYMKNKVAGMMVPDTVVERLKSAKDAKEEGIRLCVEQIEHLRTIEGVKGVHIMAMAWEEKVPEIVKRAGLRP
ncbi:MAG: methylenetetrahydrofolate reductase [Methanomassiliicoccales archaeon]|jgi:methylenetetrahydrofolate reductase (NADPH)|nr:methylenetetrahydrofolate reductase [Methanomassiliicoccales archaeon]MDD1756344.1 methylenetetrahydrofolate reductase [Methanomassiliicoccales archaeon]